MHVFSIAEFQNHYEKIRKRTLRAVSLITEETIDFTLDERMFSIGDLARHIALLELHFYQPCLQNLPPTYTGCDASFASSQKEILQVYHQATQGMTTILKDKSDSFLEERCQLPHGTIRVKKWLSLILEHEIHHRGQLYQLLSFKGIKVPDIFGLSSEELIKLADSNSDKRN
ncbi:MAG: DinB family protein [Bacteroidota bacterium]